MRKATGSTLLILTLLLHGCLAPGGEEETGASGGEAPSGLPPALFDHHVHILDPGLVEDWSSLGVPFSRPDSAYTSVSAALREGEASHAFLISMAHIYGSGEFREALGLTPGDETERVRRANDHVAREVARDPVRLVGFCAFNPLRPYATAEMLRCRQDPGLRGIKLHLPNGGVQLGNPQHRERLAAIVAHAESEDRPILLHVVGWGHEPSEADWEAFWQEVVAPHPEVELYLAHGGGGGGYRGASRLGIRTGARILPSLDRRPRVFIELSGTVLAEETDGVPASRPAELQELAGDLRSFGLEWVVFGSDYPVFSPKDFAGALQRLLPLAPEEFRQILSNRGPAMGGEE
jgi:predicted TIM-barrel fold metal-dependent hydrolase